jgi:purine-binding chemotaxis protein CheW
MMDIAEIRKKAKSGTTAQDAPPAPSTLTEESATGAAVAADAAEASLNTTTDVVSYDEQLREQDDGLERLFAATDALALAADSGLQAADDEDTQLAGAKGQYLAFYLGEEEYALDIRQISEIIKLREFTDIPRAPEFILGIISLRGVVVPVVDLGRRLNLGAAELQASSRIVVCRYGELAVGLLVDSIHQVVKLADEDVEPPPGVLSGVDREMVAGIGRYQERMIILLQLGNILNIALS